METWKIVALVIGVPLIVLILFGLYFSSTMVSPSGFLSERCTVGGDFVCENYGLEGNTVFFTLQNGFQSSLSSVVVSLDPSCASQPVDVGSLAVREASEVIEFTCESISSGWNDVYFEIEFVIAEQEAVRRGQGSLLLSAE